MDGLKGKLRESLQFRLSFALALAILLIAVITGGLSYATAFDEAHELQDTVLVQIASLYKQHPIPLQNPDNGQTSRDDDEETRVIVQILSEAPLTGKTSGGDQINIDHAMPAPAKLTDGFHTLMLDGESFRVLLKTLQDGKRLAVAQETGLRDEIAQDGALRTIMPMLFLAPILLIVAANLVRKMLRPIVTLAEEVNQRSERDLHPVEAGFLPREIRPFLNAINLLLKRATQSMEIQRRFVADAAHELRSPMTALSLQAEWMEEADMSPVARERLSSLRRGIERGRKLLEQLLTLAKAESSSREYVSAPTSIQQTYLQVLEQAMPLAKAKNIDIGMRADADAYVLVEEVDLLMVVKNIVDNAIRYTPDGGQVDLILEEDKELALLRITDSGPGITEIERDRVFDSFYRILGSNEIGSGLGLSIVKSICSRCGMEISLAYADKATQSGLEVCLSIKKVTHKASPNPIQP